jgi:hypothetical protein
LAKIHHQIDALHQLGRQIEAYPKEVELAVLRANWDNPWFTTEDINYALSVIAEQFLAKDQLEVLVNQYSGIAEDKAPQKVGLVMAGNVPLVGFHDLLMVLLAGHHAIVKQSSKDERLLLAVLQFLEDIEPELANQVTIVDRLTGFDAVIATGSNNTSRYFEYYFGQYPGIIRKNRNGVAVLTGHETQDDLRALGEDIFRYFGLGCRNVAKLYVPYGYDFQKFWDVMDEYREIIDHEKYKNNYDYNKAVLVMNEMPHMANDHLILMEHEQCASPMAMLHYEYYETQDELQAKLAQKTEQVQTIVSKEQLHESAIPFGTTQQPSLTDFPDDYDTLRFLLELGTAEMR